MAYPTVIDARIDEKVEPLTFENTIALVFSNGDVEADFASYFPDDIDVSPHQFIGLKRSECVDLIHSLKVSYYSFSSSLSGEG